MGFLVALEGEDGTALGTIEDPTNVLHLVLPEVGDSRYQCLSRIDWYGNTVFNYLQAPQLLAEWRTLESRKRDPETQRVLDGIRKLAKRLGEERHVYLKFYGD
jgi:hypothetical protein